jgi:site-specific recombinase XerD
MCSLSLPRRGPPAALAGARELAGTLLTPSLLSPIMEAGERAAFHSVEFLTARVRNPNTRDAYGRAIAEFCRWCGAHQIALPSLSSLSVGAYFNELAQRLSPASANQHLSAIRQWLEWLTRSGVLSANPAACVRGVRLSRAEGKTPVLEREQARHLFASFDSTGLVDLRDRALLGIMLYDLVRVGAVVDMSVRDFHDQDGTAWLTLREKGGKQRRLPAHHLVREDLRAYLAAAGLRGREHAKEPLFQSAPRGAKALSGKPLDRSSVLAMVKRRCRAAGLPMTICNHSFRATGITLHRENGGDIESAARLAGHLDTRTTQLYDRAPRHISSIDVERVHL